ncbi:LuxR C-terminal-related transcriptional regulator [Streptomyces sp. DH37]|uniref:helix-turn-helix transcriptional regulator n=1 Tax=Streptomyces sp. DH37 TaxID=3040122 RepID=UPI00244258A1|nr:LuxR C-terminal-related transcriptional regulator [Streptomyces sp. DH37]MDG9701544.1 LuxR C-terminal-related transcriptional regulator [Streptomyces sp. DH37]
MAILSARDYEHMLDLAVNILRSHEPSDLWPLLTEELLRALSGTLGLVKDENWTTREGVVRAWKPGEAEEESLDEVTRRLVRDGYPFADHYGASADRAPLTAVDIVGETAWRNSENRSLARRAFDTRDVLGLPLPDSRRPVRGFLIHRDREFTDREREYARRVQPLIAGADAHRRHLLRWRASQPAGPQAPDPSRLSAEYGLTPREITVLTLLGDALSATAMGRRLGISHRTVHKHIENIYRKLGTSDRLSTVLRARDLGLLGRGGASGAAGPASSPAGTGKAGRAPGRDTARFLRGPAR